MRTSLRVAIVCCAAWTLCSCAPLVQGQLTCAVVGVRDGKEVRLSRAEYRLVEAKLSSYLAQRGLILVPDVYSAEWVATVRYEPEPASPGVGTLEVLDVSLNRSKAMDGHGSTNSATGAAKDAEAGLP